MKRCVVDYPYRRGKAVRPTMVMLFNGAYGGDRAAALKVAAVYQLLEDWGLGRDDILDGAALRRGAPSLHLLYGLPKAINALDMLHVYIGDMLYSYCGLSPSRYAAIRGLFTEAASVTLTGQHLDLEARDVPLEGFTEDAYMDIARKKTGFYTGAAPCLLGATLADEKAGLGDIKKFGLMLGTAFQIMDDVLDVENDGTGKFGKIPGNDIIEGKRTLVALTALKSLKPRERKELARFYALTPDKKTPGRVAAVRKTILSSGAPALCRQKARKLVLGALRIFEKAIFPGMRRPYGGLIKEFVLRLSDRTA